MKKALSLLLLLVLVCSIFTTAFVPAGAATNATAKAKLDSICNTSPYRVGVDNYDNCYTYASGVANKMFGCAPGGVSGYTLTKPGNFMLVGQTAGTGVTASSLSNLLSKALPGDVVQMYWYYSTNITASTGRSTHTAIVYAADSSSVTFLQDGASWSSIQKTTYNYNSSYVLWKGSGFGISLYRYKNYDSLFKTQAPTYAHVWTDKLNYKVNETVTFNMSSDGNVNTLWVYRPDGTSFYVEGLQSTYTLSFSTPGYYECLIETWNGIGSFKSQRTSWYVGPPQYSIIKINKTEFAIGENVVFTFNTAAKAQYNTLWVYNPDGTSNYYQECGTGKTLSFSTPGKYKALVEAWNDIGSCKSDYVYFTVKCNSHSYTNKVTKQATCTADGVRTYTCSTCGYSYTETINKLGHSWGTPTYKWSSDNKTCTATRTCTRDSSHIETQTVNTTSQVIKQPTTTATGTRKFTATFTNSAFTTQTKNVSIPKLTEPVDDDIYFPDVKEGAWYYDAVQYVAKAGFMSGYQNGYFGPGDNLKRQDFVVILANIADVNLSSYASMTPRLKDVKKGAYYAAAVNWAVDNGIIAGYANGNFGVNDNITREQVATILYRYMGEPSVSNVNSTLAKFSDSGKISSFAKTPVAWAVQNNIISGMADGRVAPTEGASRAQIASIIMRMDQNGMF